MFGSTYPPPDCGAGPVLSRADWSAPVSRRTVARSRCTSRGAVAGASHATSAPTAMVTRTVHAWRIVRARRGAVGGNVGAGPRAGTRPVTRAQAEMSRAGENVMHRSGKGSVMDARAPTPRPFGGATEGYTVGRALRLA